MRLVIIIIFFLLEFLFTACSKHSIKANTEATEYFPNKVGDYQEYNVYDSSQVRGAPNSNYPRNYIVKINIAGIKKLVDGNDATVWEYEYPWGKELNYVRISGDTVKIYDTIYSATIRNLEFPREIYILPYQNNQTWNGKLLWVDNYSISIVSGITNNWNTFTDCFLIFHHYEGPNIEYNDKYWFKPNIGLLQKNKHQYNLGPFDIELWQLKNYYLQ